MKTKSQITIFSTGVHLQAIECTINRKKQWRWVVVGFEDESFINGQVVNPIEYSEKQEDIIEKFQSE